MRQCALRTGQGLGLGRAHCDSASGLCRAVMACSLPARVRWHGPLSQALARTVRHARHLHPRRFRLRAARRADRPASGRRAQRVAPARRPRRAPVDRIFRDLPALLQPGDLLVFNDTRVIKARLFGEKPTGGAVEALVERVLPGDEVLAHLRASKSPQPGSRVRFAGAFDAEVLGRAGPEGALFRLRFPARPARAAGAPRPRAAAALHRARRHGRGRRALPDRVRRAARRGGGADGGAALRRGAARRAGRARRAARGRDAARRRRHLPAGARRDASPSTACTASGTRWARPTVQAIDDARAPAAAASWRSARPRCARWSRRPRDGALQPAAARPTSSSRPGFDFRVVDLLITNFHLPQEHAADAGQCLCRA